MRARARAPENVTVPYCQCCRRPRPLGSIIRSLPWRGLPARIGSRPRSTTRIRLRLLQPAGPLLRHLGPQCQARACRDMPGMQLCNSTRHRHCPAVSRIEGSSSGRSSSRSASQWKERERQSRAGAERCRAVPGGRQRPGGVTSESARPHAQSALR